MFVVNQPEVFKSSTTDSMILVSARFFTHTYSAYIVFGEPKVEDMGALAQASAASQLKPQVEEIGDAPPELVEDDGEEVDASGVEDKDISLVMEQANVSRARAVKALKENGNDIVNAIMVPFSLSACYLR